MQRGTSSSPCRQAALPARQGLLAAVGIDQSAGAPSIAFVETEQRVRVLAPVAVGESIEIVSGIIAVDARELTVAHLVSSRSTRQAFDLARARSVAAPANADGAPSELDPDLIEVLERRRFTESELFGE